MSFRASWHRHAKAQPFCLLGWLCVSTGLVEVAPPALPCSHQGCGPASGSACLASLSRAKPVPSGSDILTKGLWSEVQSVRYTAPCLPLLPHQGRTIGLLQAWISSCSWLLPCSVNTLVLQPDPTAFHGLEMSAADWHESCQGLLCKGTEMHSGTGSICQDALHTCLKQWTRLG